MTIVRRVFGMVLVSFAFALPSHGQARTFTAVAFQLDEVLVQGTRAENINLFAKEDVIQVKRDDGRNSYYVVRPESRRILTQLVKDGYEIQILSTEGQRTAESIAQEFDLPELQKTLADIASRIKGRESWARLGGISLQVLGGQRGQILYLASPGTRVLPPDQEFTVHLGQPFYAFPTYASAEKAKKSGAGSAKYFPPSPESWALERGRLLAFYALLSSLNDTNPKSFRKSFQDLLRSNQENLTKFGGEMLLGSYEPIGFRWSQRGDAAVCERYVKISGQLLSEASQSECLKDNAGLHKIREIDGEMLCVLVTEDVNPVVIRSSRNLEECIQKDRSLRYLREAGSLKCVAMTMDLRRVGSAPDRYCKSEFMVTNPTDGQTYVFQAFTGVEKMSREGILARLMMPPPTREEPYQLFDPLGDLEDDGPELSACRDDGRWQTMKRDPSNRDLLAPECVPSALYSWGTETKLRNLESWMGDGEWQNSIRPLFTARSPISTHGYGVVAVRIKIKKGVKFRLSGPMKKCQDADIENSVYVRNDERFSDWVICSPKVIHSWSYFRKPHYDEVIKDFRRAMEIEEKGGQNRHRYDYYAEAQKRRGSVFTTSVDQNDFSKGGFHWSLRIMLENAIDDKGRVYFNPDLPVSEKTEESHFKAENPIYFNEQ